MKCGYCKSDIDNFPCEQCGASQEKKKNINERSNPFGYMGLMVFVERDLSRLSTIWYFYSGSQYVGQVELTRMQIEKRFKTGDDLMPYVYAFLKGETYPIV